VAVGVNEDGKREILGVHAGHSEAEVFWTEFLRALADRGLRGVKLVIADDHKGLRAAARRVFNATHQRCRIHWMRNALAHAPAKRRGAVAAMLKTIFAQESKAEAVAQWDVVGDALREKRPKLAALMDASREDVLAYMDFPREHWPQIASTDEIDKRVLVFRGSLDLRRRPRGEARRVGCKRRRAAHGCPAGLRRLRTDRSHAAATHGAFGAARRLTGDVGCRPSRTERQRVPGRRRYPERVSGTSAPAGVLGFRGFQRATNCS